MGIQEIHRLFGFVEKKRALEEISVCPAGCVSKLA
jgi:hypothetical protein